MMTVIDANLLLILVALLIGFAVGWWMFRRQRAGRDVRFDVDGSARPHLDTPREPPPAAAPKAEAPQRTARRRRRGACRQSPDAEGRGAEARAEAERERH